MYTMTSLFFLGLEGYFVFMYFLLNRFIKHLTWIITRLMEQVMKEALKCRDEKKDKGTRRRVVIRPCQL